MYADTGAGTGAGWDNLHVGAVCRHRLDSLNTSNDSLIIKKAPKEATVAGPTRGNVFGVPYIPGAF